MGRHWSQIKIPLGMVGGLIAGWLSVHFLILPKLAPEAPVPAIVAPVSMTPVAVQDSGTDAARLVALEQENDRLQAKAKQLVSAKSGSPAAKVPSAPPTVEETNAIINEFVKLNVIRPR